MKAQTTLSKLRPSLALIAIFSLCAAASAQAGFNSFRPVGITFGQTARVTAANTGTRAIIISGTFLDSEGTVLAQFDSQVIEPGKMMSFDLNADDIVRENNRIQIRGVIEGPEPHLRGAAISVEVFNNADGKTTVFVWNPGD